MGAGLGWFALLAGPLLVLRPNRLAAGEGLTAWETLGLPGLALLSGLLLLLSLGALPRRVRPVWSRLPAMAAAAVGLVLLIWLAGHGAQRITAEAMPLARVSLGWGFWLLLLGLGLACADWLKCADPRVAALAGLLWLFALTMLLASGSLDSLALMKEYQARQARFLSELWAHLAITGISVMASATVGIPLGLLLHHRRKLAPKAFLVLNITQTIPSLALFGLLLVPLSLLAARFPTLAAMGVRGVGAFPAILALSLYGLLPVVRNTHAGLGDMAPAVEDAGRGVGMSQWQLLRRVRLPLALPAILGGVRIALVQSIGNAAVAALIGAGGFGVFIFQGLGQASADLILLGALPTVLLALAADTLMQVLIPLLTPPGVGDTKDPGGRT